MSAEGKKKRGVSGMANAKNIPFRYHGVPRGYTLNTSINATTHPRLAGAKLLHTMEWARILPGFYPSDRLIRAVDATIEFISSEHWNTKSAREWKDAA